MARTPVVAGNWKMNTNAATARDLVAAIRLGGIDAIGGVERVICPPFPLLPIVLEAAEGSSLRLGAQDMYWEEKGAFTSAVSAEMLRDFVEYVLIGHSERRAYFGETDESVNRKLKAALAGSLFPVICVGETGEEHGRGETEAVLRHQVHGALRDVELTPAAVLAYEPVWAIGTGVAATAADANAAIGFIRGEVAGLQGASLADQVRVLYGGSVSPANIAEFVAQPEVDGSLAGGASLVADSFVEMVASVARLVGGEAPPAS